MPAIAPSGNVVIPTSGIINHHTVNENLSPTGWAWPRWRRWRVLDPLLQDAPSAAALDELQGLRGGGFEHVGAVVLAKSHRGAVVVVKLHIRASYLHLNAAGAGESVLALARPGFPRQPFRRRSSTDPRPARSRRFR